MSANPDFVLSKADEHRENSNFEEALSLYRKAEKGYQTLRDPAGRLVCRLSKGHCLRLIGRFKLALAEYLACEDLATETGDEFPKSKLGRHQQTVADDLVSAKIAARLACSETFLG